MTNKLRAITPRMRITFVLSRELFPSFSLRCVVPFIATLMILTGCSQNPAQPAPAEKVAVMDQYPSFFRNAKKRVIFDGSAANLSLISRTLGEAMYREMGPGFVWVVFGARGHAYYEGMLALGDKEVDFAMSTPAGIGKMAHDGTGYFEKANPNIRGVAVYPQNDWITCVVPEKLGIRSFEEIKAKKPSLKIATGPIGQHDGVGFVAEEILKGYGISAKDIESWGGKFLEARVSGAAVEKLMNGEADMACHEAWKSFYPLAAKMPLSFLPVNDEVLAKMKPFGFDRNVIKKGLFGKNMPDKDIQVVDYSDWQLLTHAEVPDDVVYTLTKVAIENRKDVDKFYLPWPEREREMDAPLKPELMWKNIAVPLHPGAEKYYREKGLIH